MILIVVLFVIALGYWYSKIQEIIENQETICTNQKEIYTELNQIKILLMEKTDKGN